METNEGELSEGKSFMKKFLMVTLSNHTSFQDGVFSMYENLKDRYEINTITIAGSTYPVSTDSCNYFIKAPLNPGVSKSTFNLKELHRMMKIVRSLSFETVYFESFHMWNYPIIFYCKSKGISYSHVINDVIAHEGDSHIWLRDVLKKVSICMFNRIILRSENGLEKAKTHYPKYAHKMHKVDLWYSFPEYCAPRGKTVLFFGRINKYKGIDKLCDLIRMTSDINYVVAGKADESISEELKLLRGLSNVKVDEGIVPYDKMHDYFYNACCVVLPYNSASQSGVVLDAYKHSRPVVAFNVGAIGEEIEDGVSGYIVEPGNLEELARRVKEIVDMDTNDFEKLCHNSYEYGIKRYSAKSREEEFLKAIGVK